MFKRQVAMEPFGGRALQTEETKNPDALKGKISPMCSKTKRSAEWLDGSE